MLHGQQLRYLLHMGNEKFGVGARFSFNRPGDQGNNQDFDVQRPIQVEPNDSSKSSRKSGSTSHIIILV